MSAAIAYLSLGAIELRFRQAMAEAGIITDAPITADGRLHRFTVDGDKRRSMNGWYVLYANPVPAGSFGCWKRGINEKWRQNGRMDRWEANEHRRLIWEAKQHRDAEAALQAELAAARAFETWNAAAPAACIHPYLLKKDVKPHGIRQRNEVLLVPVMSYDGGLSNLQRIWPDGTKRFLRFGPIRGRFYLVGDMSDRIWLAEGFSTAASLHEHTGECVACAFNASNLLPVAVEIRRRLPHADLHVMADNDRWTEGNPGITKARLAAERIGGKLHAPDFKGLPLDDRPTDFNDWMRLRRGM